MNIWTDEIINKDHEWHGKENKNSFYTHICKKCGIECSMGTFHDNKMMTSQARFPEYNLTCAEIVMRQILE